MTRAAQSFLDHDDLSQPDFEAIVQQISPSKDDTASVNNNAGAAEDIISTIICGTSSSSSSQGRTPQEDYPEINTGYDATNGWPAWTAGQVNMRATYVHFLSSCPCLGPIIRTSTTQDETVQQQQLQPWPDHASFVDCMTQAATTFTSNNNDKHADLTAALTLAKGATCGSSLTQQTTNQTANDDTNKLEGVYSHFLVTCPCFGHRNKPWTNHEEFMDCVSIMTQAFVDENLLTTNEENVIDARATQSTCGTAVGSGQISSTGNGTDGSGVAYGYTVQWIDDLLDHFQTTCPCIGPNDETTPGVDGTWDNHEAYLACMQSAAKEFLPNTPDARGEILDVASSSDCGNHRSENNNDDDTVQTLYQHFSITCPCLGQGNHNNGGGTVWDNHDAYMDCMRDASNEFVESNSMDDVLEQKVLSMANDTTCGTKDDRSSSIQDNKMGSLVYAHFLVSCPCVGPTGSSKTSTTITTWTDHDTFVVCMTEAANAFLENGDIDTSEKDAIINQAISATDCGKDGHLKKLKEEHAADELFQHLELDCPCVGPLDEQNWKQIKETWESHDAYVSCMVEAADMFQQNGDIGRTVHDRVVQIASATDCGSQSTFVGSSSSTTNSNSVQVSASDVYSHFLLSCPCLGQGGSTWKSHTNFIDCMSDAAIAFLDDGDINEQIKSQLIDMATTSTCGNDISVVPAHTSGRGGVTLSQSEKVSQVYAHFLVACPCLGPNKHDEPAAWDTPADFMNCIKESADAFLDNGEITQKEQSLVLNLAGESDCGSWAAYSKEGSSYDELVLLPTDEINELIAHIVIGCPCIGPLDDTTGKVLGKWSSPDDRMICFQKDVDLFLQEGYIDQTRHDQVLTLASLSGCADNSDADVDNENNRLNDRNQNGTTIKMFQNVPQLLHYLQEEKCPCRGPMAGGYDNHILTWHNQEEFLKCIEISIATDGDYVVNGDTLTVAVKNDLLASAKKTNCGTGIEKMYP
eukprot:scaffold12564_cov60-Attheya_sp.AAC.8